MPTFMTVLPGGRCLVKADSQAVTSPKPSFEKNQPSYARERARLIAAGTLIPFTAKSMRFVRDHIFSSPSAAAAVIRGTHGGLTYWIGNDGRTIQDRLRMNPASDEV